MVQLHLATLDLTVSPDVWVVLIYAVCATGFAFALRR